MQAYPLFLFFMKARLILMSKKAALSMVKFPTPLDDGFAVAIFKPKFDGIDLKLSNVFHDDWPPKNHDVFTKGCCQHHPLNCNSRSPYDF